MARRNLLRSWLAAALPIAAVMAPGLVMARAVPAGAARPRYHEIFVSDAGFSPPIVEGVNVGDVLVFELYQTTNKHTITFEDPSLCPGNRGAVPCWPELRFDQDQPAHECSDSGFVLPGWRCMLVREPGKTVQYHDAYNASNVGEIRVLGQATTTTGPATTTTTARPSTTTTTGAPTTSTTSRTTTTTAPTQLRPFVIQDSGPTTSTMAPAAPVTVANTRATPAPPAKKDKDKGKGAKVKSAAVETPTTVASAPADAPPDSVFDPAALTPGPIELPDAPGDPADGDEVDLESAAIMNLLDREEVADHRALLLALGALTFLLFLGGVWAWFHRASRYDPA